MKFFERTILLITTLLILYRLFFWKELDHLLVLAFGITSSLYMFFSFPLILEIKVKNILKLNSYFRISKLKLLGIFISGISISFVCIGVGLSMISWPGSTFFLFAGTLSSIITVLIWLIKNHLKQKNLNTDILTRLLIASFIGLTLVFIPQYSFNRFLFRNDPKYYVTTERKKELKDQVLLHYKNLFEGKYTIDELYKTPDSLNPYINYEWSDSTHLLFVDTLVKDIQNGVTELEVSNFNYESYNHLGSFLTWDVTIIHKNIVTTIRTLNGPMLHYIDGYWGIFSTQLVPFKKYPKTEGEFIISDYIQKTTDTDRKLIEFKYAKIKHNKM